MKKNDYVYVVMCEGSLSTDHWCDLEAIFATEESAKEGMKESASQLLSNIGQYIDFEDGYETYEDYACWGVRSKKWPDLYIEYFYERVLVQ